jgi:hypothetical protein
MDILRLTLIVDGKRHDYAIAHPLEFIVVNGARVRVEARNNTLHVHDNAKPHSASLCLASPAYYEALQCSKCGNLYTESYSRCRELELMQERHICFHCAFWYATVEKYADDPLWFRIKGESYHPSTLLERGDQAELAWSKGYGGGEFCIRKTDGTLYRTDNLWHQGSLPAWMRDRFPDNAEFITRDIWERST